MHSHITSTKSHKNWLAYWLIHRLAHWFPLLHADSHWLALTSPVRLTTSCEPLCDPGGVPGLCGIGGVVLVSPPGLIPGEKRHENVGCCQIQDRSQLNSKHPNRVDRVKLKDPGHTVSELVVVRSCGRRCAGQRDGGGVRLR